MGNGTGKKAGLNIAAEETIDRIFKILIRPKGLRFRLKKWFSPELREIASVLRNYYWGEDKSKPTDTEET